MHCFHNCCSLNFYDFEYLIYFAPGFTITSYTVDGVFSNSHGPSVELYQPATFALDCPPPQPFGRRGLGVRDPEGGHPSPASIGYLRGGASMANTARRPWTPNRTQRPSRRASQLPSPPSTAPGEKREGSNVYQPTQLGRQRAG